MTAAALPAPDVPTPPRARGRVPGNHGIWVGITCVFVEFLLLFTVDLVASAHDPDAFEAGPGRLSTVAGTVITLLMVTSSFFIACSVVRMRAGCRRESIGWLVAGLVAALGYPLTKYLEIGWNVAHGIDGEPGIFFTLYYHLTLTHLVHGFWGILGMLWVLARHLASGYTAANHDGLEALASCWHATDIIWLTIFPLCYVLA